MAKCDAQCEAYEWLLSQQVHVEVRRRYRERAICSLGRTIGVLDDRYAPVPVPVRGLFSLRWHQLAKLRRAGCRVTFLHREWKGMPMPLFDGAGDLWGSPWGGYA